MGFFLLQIERIVVHSQTVSSMECDMDRWIKDRDELSKKIENCNTMLLEANTGNVTTDIYFMSNNFSFFLLFISFLFEISKTFSLCRTKM